MNDEWWIFWIACVDLGISKKNSLIKVRDEEWVETAGNAKLLNYWILDSFESLGMRFHYSI